MSSHNITGATCNLGGKFQATLRAEGFRGLLRRLSSLFKMGVRVVDAHILSLTYADLNPVPSPAISVEVKELTEPDESEMETLAGFRFHTNSREDVLLYLEQGQHCYVAKHRGQVISCFWTQSKEFYDYRLKRWLQLADDEEYALGFFTRPEFRGKGIFDYLYVEALRLRPHRVSNLRTVIFVDVHNQASLKAASKIGFKKVGRIGYLGLFGLRFQYILGCNVLPHSKKRFLITI